MLSRSRSVTLLGALALIGGVALTGCQRDAAVTPKEEAQFKNPPKEMPPEAREAMKKMGGGGPPPGATAPAAKGN